MIARPSFRQGMVSNAIMSTCSVRYGVQNGCNESGLETLARSALVNHVCYTDQDGLIDQRVNEFLAFISHPWVIQHRL